MQQLFQWFAQAVGVTGSSLMMAELGAVQAAEVPAYMEYQGSGVK